MSLNTVLNKHYLGTRNRLTYICTYMHICLNKYKRIFTHRDKGIYIYNLHLFTHIQTYIFTLFFRVLSAFASFLTTS